jgi:uncharacterized membrane protein
MRKLAAVLAIIFSLSLPSFALAQLTAEGSGLMDTATGIYDTQSNSLAYFIGLRIIRPVIGLTGLIFFVLMVYAGVLWMTSRGDAKQVDKAKGILTAGVIGAVIIAAAYAITDTVIDSLSGQPAPASNVDNNTTTL